VSSGPVLVDDFSGVGALDAINETAAPVAYRVRMRYSEPMDVSPAGAPTFTSTATNAPTATWSWDPTDATQRTAILTLTIPPNGDSTGAFLIRGGRDSSSVAVAQAGDVVGVLGGRRELLQNGNFQVGSACSLANWTPETTMSAPPPVAISNNGAIAGATSPCAAVLGSVPGTPPTTGRARLFQDVTVPSTMMTGFTLTASARTRGVFVASRVTPGASYAMQCRVETTATPPVSQGSLGGHSGSGSTDAVQAAYQASNIASIAQSSVTLRVLCESDNATTFAGTGAFYVDEVSLALVRPGTL
ncbi:MAG: hypothetical protein INH37_17700, partial [Myxococcaceae bacterium]|nr:hypothetical protein [Myxococcaceae bacterium]